MNKDKLITGVYPSHSSSSTYQKIAARAEALWRRKGRPAGRDNEIWLEAERQLFGLQHQSASLEDELSELFPGPADRSPTSL